MKIFNNNIQKVLNAYNKNTNTKKVKESNRFSKKDEFSISKEAKEIQRAMKAAKNSPDIRKEKIQEIRERINSGNYNVDAKKIAEKMIDEANMFKDHK